MKQKVILLISLALCYTLSGMAQMVFIEGLVKYTILSPKDMTVSATWAENAPEDVVVIPATVEYNGQTYAVANVDFNNDTPVYQLVISEGITTIKEIKSAYRDNSSLKRLELPGSLKEIPRDQFTYFTGLEEVSLGEGIESIGVTCFHNSHLHHLHIPASVKKIGNALCYIDKLEEITVHPDNPYYYSQNNTLIDKEKNSVLLGNRDIFIPNNVTSINSEAYRMHNYQNDHFREKDAPRDLIIPQNITLVNFGCFTIDSINTLRIPNTTTLDFGCIYLGAAKEIIIEDGDTPFYYTPLMLGEGCFRFYSGYVETEIETLYIGRNKQGWGDLFEGFRTLTVNNLIIRPEVTEYTEYNKYIIKAIYSLSKNPEQVTIGFSSSFYAGGSNHNTYAETPLYVPVGTKERYMAAEGWKNFQIIKEMGASGINATHLVNGNNGNCYNLQGQQLKSVPQKGIYIQNGKKYVAK